MTPKERLQAALRRIAVIDPDLIECPAGDFMTEQVAVLAETVADFIQPE